MNVQTKLNNYYLFLEIYDRYSPNLSSSFTIECSDVSTGVLVAIESIVVLKNCQEQVLQASFNVRTVHGSGAHYCVT